MGSDNVGYLKDAASDPATVLSFLAAVTPGYRRYDANGRPIDINPKQGLAGMASLFAQARDKTEQTKQLSDIAKMMDPDVLRKQPADIVQQTSPEGQPNEYTGAGWQDYAQGLKNAGTTYEGETRATTLPPGADKPAAGGVNAQGMPVLPTSGFQQRQKDIEQFKPPSMASYIKGMTPMQKQAFMAGGSQNPLANLVGQGTPPMVQQFQTMQTEANKGFTYQKEQLFTQAAQALQKDPTNDDAAQAVFTLATDLGKDPIAWQKNMRQRGSAIQWMTKNVGATTMPDGTINPGYRDNPAAAAQALDANPEIVAQLMQAQMALQARQVQTTAQFKAYEAMNPPPASLAAARAMASAGIPIDDLMKGGLAGQEKTQAWAKYPGLLTGLYQGKPMGGVGLDGKPIPGSEGGAAALQDIVQSFPLYSAEVLKQQEVAQNHQIQWEGLQLQRQDAHQIRLMREETAAWQKVGYAEKNVDTAIKAQAALAQDLTLGDQKGPKFQAAAAMAARRIQEAKNAAQIAHNRFDIKYGNVADVIRRDQGDLEMEIARVNAVKDPSERIRQATRLFQGLELSRQAYGAGSEPWMSTFFSKAQQDIQGLFPTVGEEATPAPPSTWGQAQVGLPTPGGMVGQTQTPEELQAQQAAQDAAAAQHGKRMDAAGQDTRKLDAAAAQFGTTWRELQRPGQEAKRRRVQAAAQDLPDIAPPPMQAAPTTPYGELPDAERQRILTPRELPPPPGAAVTEAPKTEASKGEAVSPTAEFNFPAGTRERSYLDAASPGQDFEALSQEDKVKVFQRVFGGQKIFTR